MDRTPEHQPEQRLTRPSQAMRDNRFEIDQRLVPPGMVMEWKRVSLLGQEDKRNQVICNQFHWRPVPHGLQPAILGHLAKTEKQPIVQDGLMLMMRPKYLNDEAHEEREDMANYTIGQQLQALGNQSKNEVGQKNTKFKREFVQPQPVE